MELAGAMEIMYAGVVEGIRETRTGSIERIVISATDNMHWNTERFNGKRKTKIRPTDRR